MEVRPAEIARLEPVHDHVQAGFLRIADEHRLVDARGTGRIAPFELIGRFVREGRGVEVGGEGRTRRQHQ